MTSNQEYIVIESYHNSTLVAEVKKKLDLGWVLKGGVAVVSASPNNITFYQAMTRFTEK